MKQNPNHTKSAGAGHNRSRIELVPVAVLKVREGDPRRYSPRDIELAQAALRQLPVGVPLPVVVNAEGEILVGGLFVAAARKLEIKSRCYPPRGAERDRGEAILGRDQPTAIEGRVGSGRP